MVILFPEIQDGHQLNYWSILSFRMTRYNYHGVYSDFLEEATNPIIQYINRSYVPEMLISTDQGETDNKHDCQLNA